MWLKSDSGVGLHVDGWTIIVCCFYCDCFNTTPKSADKSILLDTSQAVKLNRNYRINGKHISWTFPYTREVCHRGIEEPHRPCSPWLIWRNILSLMQEKDWIRVIRLAFKNVIMQSALSILSVGKHLTWLEFEALGDSILPIWNACNWRLLSWVSMCKLLGISWLYSGVCPPIFMIRDRCAGTQAGSSCRCFFRNTIKNLSLLTRLLRQLIRLRMMKPSKQA